MSNAHGTDDQRDQDRTGGATNDAAVAQDAAEAATDELSALRRECDALRDKNLRLLAEARNMQQRAARDKEEGIRYAEFDFARELLPSVDGLERALASAATGTDAAAVVDGVRIVYEQFLKALRERQIEPIEATGKPFDPAVHEAIMQQPSRDHPNNTVVQEVQRGYKMRDRVLRAARVIVSKSDG